MTHRNKKKKQENIETRLVPIDNASIFWSDLSLAVQILLPLALAALLFSKKFSVYPLHSYLSGLWPSASQKQRLLTWLGEKIPYMNSMPKKISQYWKDGSLLCTLINTAIPGACPNPQRHWKQPPVHAQALAYKYFGLEPILTSADFAEKKLGLNSERRFVNYLLALQEVILRISVDTDTLKFTNSYIARGMGLIIGEQNKPSTFYLYPNADSRKLDNVFISIKGPYSSYGKQMISSGEMSKNAKRLAKMRKENNEERKKLTHKSKSQKYFFKPLSFDIGPIFGYLSKDGKHGDISIKVEMEKDRAKVTFTPKHSGMYELALTSNDEHIHGSPFIVRVTKPTNKEYSELKDFRLRGKRKIFAKNIDFIDETVDITEENKVFLKLDQNNNRGGNDQNSKNETIEAIQIVQMNKEKADTFGQAPIRLIIGIDTNVENQNLSNERKEGTETNRDEKEEAIPKITETLFHKQSNSSNGEKETETSNDNKENPVKQETTETLFQIENTEETEPNKDNTKNQQKEEESILTSKINIENQLLDREISAQNVLNNKKLSSKEELLTSKELSNNKAFSSDKEPPKEKGRLKTTGYFDEDKEFDKIYQENVSENEDANFDTAINDFCEDLKSEECYLFEQPVKESRMGLKNKGDSNNPMSDEDIRMIEENNVNLIKEGKVRDTRRKFEADCKKAGDMLGEKESKRAETSLSKEELKTKKSTIKELRVNRANIVEEPWMKTNFEEAENRSIKSVPSRTPSIVETSSLDSKLNESFALETEAEETFATKNSIEDDLCRTDNSSSCIEDISFNNGELTSKIDDQSCRSENQPMRVEVENSSKVDDQLSAGEEVSVKFNTVGQSFKTKTSKNFSKDEGGTFGVKDRPSKTKNDVSKINDPSLGDEKGAIKSIKIRDQSFRNGNRLFKNMNQSFKNGDRLLKDEGQFKSGDRSFKIEDQRSKIGDQSLENGDRSLNVGDRSLRIGDQSPKIGDQSLKIGDQPLKTVKIADEGNQSLKNVGRLLKTGDQPPRIGDQSLTIGDQSPKVQNQFDSTQIPESKRTDSDAKNEDQSLKRQPFRFFKVEDLWYINQNQPSVIQDQSPKIGDQSPLDLKTETEEILVTKNDISVSSIQDQISRIQEQLSRIQNQPSKIRERSVSIQERNLNNSFDLKTEVSRIQDESFKSQNQSSRIQDHSFSVEEINVNDSFDLKTNSEEIFVAKNDISSSRIQDQSSRIEDQEQKIQQRSFTAQKQNLNDSFDLKTDSEAIFAIKNGVSSDRISDQSSMIQDQSSRIQGEPSKIQNNSSSVQEINLNDSFALKTDSKEILATKNGISSSRISDQSSRIQDQSFRIQEKSSKIQNNSSSVQDINLNDSFALKTDSKQILATKNGISSSRISDQSSRIQDQSFRIQEKPSKIQERSFSVQERNLNDSFELKTVTEEILAMSAGISSSRIQNQSSRIQEQSSRIQDQVLKIQERSFSAQERNFSDSFDIKTETEEIFAVENGISSLKSQDKSSRIQDQSSTVGDQPSKIQDSSFSDREVNFNDSLDLKTDTEKILATNAESSSSRIQDQSTRIQEKSSRIQYRPSKIQDHSFSVEEINLNESFDLKTETEEILATKTGISSSRIQDQSSRIQDESPRIEDQPSKIQERSFSIQERNINDSFSIKTETEEIFAAKNDISSSRIQDKSSRIQDKSSRTQDQPSKIQDFSFSAQEINLNDSFGVKPDPKGILVTKNGISSSRIQDQSSRIQGQLSKIQDSSFSAQEINLNDSFGVKTEPEEILATNTGTSSLRIQDQSSRIQDRSSKIQGRSFSAQEINLNDSSGLKSETEEILVTKNGISSSRIEDQPSKIQDRSFSDQERNINDSLDLKTEAKNGISSSRIQDRSSRFIMDQSKKLEVMRKGEDLNNEEINEDFQADEEASCISEDDPSEPKEDVENLPRACNDSGFVSSTTDEESPFPTSRSIRNMVELFEGGKKTSPISEDIAPEVEPPEPKGGDSAFPGGENQLSEDDGFSVNVFEMKLRFEKKIQDAIPKKSQYSSANRNLIKKEVSFTRSMPNLAIAKDEYEKESFLSSADSTNEFVMQFREKKQFWDKLAESGSTASLGSNYSDVENMAKPRDVDCRNARSLSVIGRSCEDAKNTPDAPVRDQDDPNGVFERIRVFEKDFDSERRSSVLKRTKERSLRSLPSFKSIRSAEGIEDINHMMRDQPVQDDLDFVEESRQRFESARHFFRSIEQINLTGRSVEGSRSNKFEQKSPRRSVSLKALNVQDRFALDNLYRDVIFNKIRNGALRGSCNRDGVVGTLASISSTESGLEKDFAEEDDIDLGYFRITKKPKRRKSVKSLFEVNY